MMGKWSMEFDELLRYSGLHPVYEYRFHPVRKWRFDFSFPDKKLAVEFEGGIWGASAGRHNRGSGFLKDCEKYNEAAILGWRIIRITDLHVRNGQGLKWVLQALELYP